MFRNRLKNGIKRHEKIKSVITGYYMFGSIVIFQTKELCKDVVLFQYRHQDKRDDW